MNRHLKFALLALGLAAGAAACGDDENPPERFRATLNGANERPTPRTTTATGRADLAFRNDVLSWTVTMNNITNISGAHIHIGGAEESGGVLLPLATTATLNNSTITGSIARSAFTPPGAPNENVTFDQLLARMRAGTVYVNIHTNDPNNPTNNSQGDFPGGEIRGQINPR